MNNDAHGDRPLAKRWIFIDIRQFAGNAFTIEVNRCLVLNRNNA